MQTATFSPRRQEQAFTLIELLIVVAIIAILAAIAVPNFLEAQTRAKVSRARSDLRTLATALESYRVDNTQYPPTPFVTGGDVGVLRVIPNHLSTPISYISDANFRDPFIGPRLGDFRGIARSGAIVTYSADTAYPMDPGGDPSAGKRYYYQNNRDPRRVSFAPSTPLAIAARQIQGDWVMTSLGPDEKRNLIDHPTLAGFSVYMPYDPTNGTISDGDIIRTQRESQGTLVP